MHIAVYKLHLQSNWFKNNLKKTSVGTWGGTMSVFYERSDMCVYLYVYVCLCIVHLDIVLKGCKRWVESQTKNT